MNNCILTRAIYFTGVLIFEMHCGYAPFYHDNTFNTYERILAATIEWQKFVDPTVKDIVKKLLVVDKAKRLGNLKVRDHVT